MEEFLSHIAPWFPAAMGLVITGLGVLIGWLGLRHSHQLARDSWLRTYKDLHEVFWSDPDFPKIRAWLACDSAYSQVVPVLRKRMKIDQEPAAQLSLTEDEYAQLEKLDRFLNFMMRVITVLKPEFTRRKDLWTKLYFDYWLAQFGKESRRELAWYLERFYPDLTSLLPASLARYGLIRNEP